MKTAISIATPLLEEADRTARKLGVTRSRLIGLALTDYLRQSRNREITEQLNDAYKEAPEPDELTGSEIRAKFGSTVKDRW
jgi:metal-responsive CopG/Arc/MetJ family transcriptional regulator